MFALTMEVNLEWRDHRLMFKNLRKGLGQNQLTEYVTLIQNVDFHLSYVVNYE